MRDKWDGDRTGYAVQRRSLRDPEDRSFVLSLTPSERVAMVWTLTCQAWSFAGDFDCESRLPRHVVRVVRGGG